MFVCLYVHTFNRASFQVNVEQRRLSILKCFLVFENVYVYMSFPLIFTTFFIMHTNSLIRAFGASKQSLMFEESILISDTVFPADPFDDVC